MAMRIRIAARRTLPVLLAGIILMGLLPLPGTAQQPRRGNKPHYNLLVKFETRNFPKVAPDLAESWTVSRDGMTWTFKIRQGVKFHDGSTLTSRDIKATFDRITFPPEGVVSVRQAVYQGVKSIEAPDPQTVVFRLKWAVPSFLEKLASPFNWVYKAENLARDPRWYERN